MGTLTLNQLHKSYRQQVILSEVCAHFEPSHSYVIVGRNGVGKSTLLTLLAGLAKPDSGTVVSTGVIGFVPQHDMLFESLKVKDNLNFWLAAHQQPWDTIAPYVAMFGIDTYLNQRVKKLSGGMKKAVAICCGLTTAPTILIMDEPFAGLDVVYKDTLLQLVSQLKSQHKTVIYTSHNLDEIIGTDSHLYTLSQGQLTPKGHSRELIHVTDFVALFEGEPS